MIVVPYRADGTCEAHIRALNLEDIRSDRPGVPPAPEAAFAVHRASPGAHTKYEKRAETQRLKKEQARREHGLVA